MKELVVIALILTWFVSVYAAENRGLRLISVEYKEEPGEENIDGLIKGEFRLVRSITEDKNVLGILLINETDEDAKVSQLRIAHDESYVIFHDGEEVPFDLSNPIWFELWEEARERSGVRWVEIKPGESALVTIDPSIWGVLRNVEFEGDQFVIEIRPGIPFVYHARPVLLKFEEYIVEPEDEDE